MTREKLESITIITDDGELVDQTIKASHLTMVSSMLNNQKERGKEVGVTLSTPEGLVTARDIKVN